VSETILWLIAFILVVGVARSVLRIVFKGFADLFNPQGSQGQNQGQGSPTGARSAPLPTSDALKKDPVCGTFIAASTSLHKTVGGQTYYFCSTECRDKFQG
jgi:YHS domain-containing protein